MLGCYFAVMYWNTSSFVENTKLDTRKTCDKVTLESISVPAETIYLQNGNFEWSLYIAVILSRQWITKMQIRLCICTAWSASLLFIMNKLQVSQAVAQVCVYYLCFINTSKTQAWIRQTITHLRRIWLEYHMHDWDRTETQLSMLPLFYASGILQPIQYNKLWFVHYILRGGQKSVKSESMCTKYWLTPCSSLTRKTCG